MIFLRNLRRAPLRSLGTVLGLAIGIALLVAVQSITADLRRQIDEAVGVYQMEMVVYERRASSPLSSRITQPQMDGLLRRFGDAASPLVIVSLNEAWNAYAMVVGTDQAFAQRLPIVQGRLWRLTAGPVPEVIVGELAALRLGLKPGADIEFAGRRHAVVGIFRTGSRLFDGAVSTDLDYTRQLNAREGEAGTYTLAVLRAADAGLRQQWAGEIATAWPSLKAIAGTEFAGSLRLLGVVNAFVRTLSALVIAATVMMLINTLLMSLRERVREIGILMAIGWTPWRVLGLFGAEAAVLACAGAALGVVAGLVLLRVVNAIDSLGFGWIPLAVDPVLVASAFGVTLLAGLVALLVPAFVLWRTQPLTALRHE